MKNWDKYNYFKLWHFYEWHGWEIQRELGHGPFARLQWVNRIIKMPGSGRNWAAAGRLWHDSYMLRRLYRGLHKLHDQ